MRLTVVGCAGSFPRAGAACSAYLVEAAGFRLLLDMGNGSLGALQQHIGLLDLDALFISHLHGDHCFDACAYVVASRYSPEAPVRPLPLYAPAGALDRLARAYEIDGAAASLDDVYDEHVLVPGVLQIGPFQVTVDRTNHPVETYGARVEHDGRVLAYSADSGCSDALVDLARGADTFLCEATFDARRRNPPDLHLTGGQAGEHAARAGADRLLLTHLTAWIDPQLSLADAQAAFDGTAAVVAPGEVYDI
ncbi:MAG: MBL fold metallo-hydrolase [Actinomycetota bacterium]|nr:MBL fold metallo-hydrolase [Actinomycetota bacterium]